MSEAEVKELREQMYCMERKLLQAIADIRVHLAENYVTKSDQKWVVGITATISGIFVGIISSIVSWIRGN